MNMLAQAAETFMEGHNSVSHSGPATAAYDTAAAAPYEHIRLLLVGPATATTIMVIMG